jgi:L-glutamine-phosphate cytidylyltransferase
MQLKRHLLAACTGNESRHGTALESTQSMAHPRTAIILAAGSGSRLLPHTAHAPKCLTSVAGQPILRYQIAALRHCGIPDIVIVVGYKSDCIRDFVDSSVTLVDNPDFAVTNSSYSLWLAREHMSDGFIHLNSDLLFEPTLLRALLTSPAENAIVVDRCVRAGSDMMKSRMQGSRILSMSKDPTDDAAAEVIGPAKFGRAGAAWIVRRLSQLEEESDRNRWAYSVFGELASQMRLVGVDNPGCFWDEIDTLADHEAAERRIPASLVQLARQEADATAVTATGRSAASGVLRTHVS